jgi:hypothetical protein
MIKDVCVCGGGGGFVLGDGAPFLKVRELNYELQPEAQS